MILKSGSDLPGRLFIVEGCDGSGKSTQVYLLRKWLEHFGIPVFFTEWNSSELIHEATSQAKKKNLLTPLTFSLMHASDFAERYENYIQPHLKAGYVVLSDRYIYTAYARDRARGCDEAWVRNMYSFAAKPNIAFYFQTPLQIALARILKGRPELKYHEAGLDLGLSTDPEESFRLYQGLLKQYYDDMAGIEGFTIINGADPIEDQQHRMRAAVMAALSDYAPPQGAVVYARTAPVQYETPA